MRVGYARTAYLISPSGVDKRVSVPRTAVQNAICRALVTDAGVIIPSGIGIDSNIKDNMSGMDAHVVRNKNGTKAVSQVSVCRKIRQDIGVEVVGNVLSNVISKKEIRDCIRVRKDWGLISVVSMSGE